GLPDGATEPLDDRLRPDPGAVPRAGRIVRLGDPAAHHRRSPQRVLVLRRPLDHEGRRRMTARSPTDRARALSTEGNDRPKRCAIYTRKSTSNGLEQEFNSLDAQREACLEYIRRQPGWVALPGRYDDGGFTGANTERPAFVQLLADVDAGQV